MEHFQFKLVQDNQKDLEMATETLSEYLERDITSECLSDIKQKVQDKYRYFYSRAVPYFFFLISKRGLIFFLISKRGLPFKKKKKSRRKLGGGGSFLEGQKAGLRFPSEFPPKLMNTSVQYAFLRLKTYVILITIYYIGGFRVSEGVHWRGEKLDSF